MFLAKIFSRFRCKIFNRFLIIFIVLPFISNGQIEDSEIISQFEDFTEAPREVVYVHLNKTTFIKGEMIGFSAYVFDKASKELSFSTTNLYCTITDNENKIIRSGLFSVKSGVTSNVFDTDSLFTSGNYTFNAYTNWMRNFKEKNYYSQQIRVIDTDIEKEEQPNEKEIVKLDIQALPEGGHLLANTKNVVGIVIKNQYGEGISDISGLIVDENDNKVSDFTLNKFGIGKTTFTPKNTDKYFVKFSFGFKDYKHPIESPKKNGIGLSVQDNRDKVVLSLFTNEQTLPTILNKNYVLTLHNGTEIEGWEFNFKEDKTSLNKVFNKANLYPGINIFTIFDSENNPLLERMFFNHDNITRVSSVSKIETKIKDSLDILIKIPNLKPNSFNSLSVSILPTETKSYSPNEGIVSSLFVKPYLKGKVENIEYYFKDITAKKQFELDNLLLTQGWSSYNWGEIFGPLPETAFSFEQGISYKANRNGNYKVQYLIQALKNSKSVLFDLKEDDKSFQAAALFPVANDQLLITEINPKNGKTKKPSLYLTFKPNRIPLLNKLSLNNTNVEGKKAIFSNTESNTVNLDEIQKLDEVQLSVKVQRTRYESLKKLSRGTIDIFDDMKRNAYTDFATYIASKGFIVNENIGQPAANGERVPLLTIYNTRKNRLTGNLDSPLIFLNDVPLDDLSVLYGFKMDIVDYIEIDKSGSSMGMRGAFGVIKIYTDPSVTLKSKDFRDIQIIDFPLKFNSQKAYYTPKYKYYNTPFFKKYGTIGWASNLTPNINGVFKIRVFNPKINSINLYIEGITNNNEFISEITTVNLN
ncbi:hypothetical protein DFQ05_1459 [Winogradskyella wandonensis]|uniref:TonB-dependent receptor-like protein n=1 Tax=Winogradskyella wandonensis TaxID=1442586 RepID=A0A4R1KSW0_9FLAO|nr:hypothetical protein [Winogradskyella wandonensis]TCK67680.1 hypothetical protein DFQ05_1459 [Winogradskyella wandonensis]